MSDSEGSLKDFVVEDDETSTDCDSSSEASVASDDSRKLVKIKSAKAKKVPTVRRTRGNADQCKFQ